MKRNESVLVYGVTGLLLVILVVAVVFGNEGRDAPISDLDSGAVAKAGADLMEGADPAGPSAADPSGVPSIAELMGQVDGEFDPIEGEGEVQVGEVPLSLTVKRSLSPILGENRVDTTSGQPFRVVTVRYGDTFSGLLMRWCVTDREDEALALNEELDFDRLRPGLEVYLPFVDDETVLEAYDRRQSEMVAAAAEAVSRPRQAAPVATPAVPAATRTSRRHVVKPGESLWVIAVREVGARRAKAYIQDIMQANPQLSDPERIRAQTKLVLPATVSHDTGSCQGGRYRKQYPTHGSRRRLRQHRTTRSALL